MERFVREKLETRMGKKEIINIACIKFNSFEDVYLRRINLYCRTNKIKPLPIYILKTDKN